jgi:hypothetical protein
MNNLKNSGMLVPVLKYKTQIVESLFNMMVPVKLAVKALSRQNASLVVAKSNFCTRSIKDNPVRSVRYFSKI